MSDTPTVSKNTLKTLFLQFASGGLANSIVSAMLNPMDVSKTRMQAETLKSNQVMNKSNLLRTFRTLYQEGGLMGLWMPGLSASIAREMVYSGSRAGMYVPVRNHYMDFFGTDSALCKVAAAMTTGKLNSVLIRMYFLLQLQLGFKSIFHLLLRVLLEHLSPTPLML